MNRLRIGKDAELTALRYLRARGLTLKEKNFRSRYGEIDLIMQDTDCIVFVEVRMRSRNSYGGGAESVDIRKQRKLCLTALYYLQKNRLNDSFCRFDVLSLGHQHNDQKNILWIKHAFDHHNPGPTTR